VVWQKVILFVSAIAWWLLCEYIRSRLSNRRMALLFTILGYGGGWLLILLAVLR
jgi:hypothetical protein